MNRVRLFTTLITAAMVAAALPFCANAAMLTEPVTWPSPTVITLASSPVSAPFPEFNPALGTLTDYSLTVAGTGTSTNSFGVTDFRFLAPGTGNISLDFIKGLPSFSFSGTGTTSNPGDLAGITGTGDASFSVTDIFQRAGDSTSLTFMGSSVTFDFTPPATVPEPASLPLLGVAMVSLFGWLRCRRRAQS